MKTVRAAIIPVTEFQQNCTLLWDNDTMQAVVIDPGGDLPRLRKAIAETKVKVEKIWLTHGHIDHAGAAAELREELGVPIEGPHRAEEFLLGHIAASGLKFGMFSARNVVPDRWLDEGDEVEIGTLKFGVLHCPGHSPGSVAFVHAARALRRRRRRAVRRLDRPQRPAGRRSRDAPQVDQRQAAAARRRRHLHLRPRPAEHHRPRAGDEPVPEVSRRFAARRGQL